MRLLLQGLLPRHTGGRLYRSWGCLFVTLTTAPSCCSLAWLPPIRQSSRLTFRRQPYRREGRLYHSNPIRDAAATPEEIKLTSDCRSMVQAAIQAVDPVHAVKKHLGYRSDKEDSGKSWFTVAPDQEYAVQDYDEICLVAFGKASSAMACAVLDRLQECPAPRLPLSGLVICKDGHATRKEEDYLQSHGIQVRYASHPVPDARSVEASRELLELVKEEDASKRRLVLVCISGGGSALFCAPHPKLTLTDLQETNTVLLQSGWEIGDMNVVRKRLEQGKGGRLAAAAGNSSHVVSLILSDVLGDPLDLIASGPTVPDTSTWQDAWELVEHRLPQGLILPESVLKLLRDGQQEKIPDSPSRDHPIFATSHECLVGNNALAVQAAAQRATELGYQPIVLATQLQGEASQVARVLVSLSQHLRQTSPLLAEFSLTSQFPVALIAGGETTATLPSDCQGKGGRNQELALTAAMELHDLQLRQVVVASVGTDGNDGPTDAAGAVVDGGTISRLSGDARKHLRNHDAYPYLEQTDDRGESPLIKTGPTGTNVADICIVLVQSNE